MLFDCFFAGSWESSPDRERAPQLRDLECLLFDAVWLWTAAYGIITSYHVMYRHWCKVSAILLCYVSSCHLMLLRRAPAGRKRCKEPRPRGNAAGPRGGAAHRSLPDSAGPALSLRPPRRGCASGSLQAARRLYRRRRQSGNACSLRSRWGENTHG